MKQDTFYRLDEMLCRELDSIAQRGELSSSALQQASMILDAMKDIRTIDAMEADGEYSQTGAYDGGGSYAGNRGHYVRAHYSRDGGGYDRDGYGGSNSYGRGRYSRDDEKEDMLRRLERMSSQASNPGEADAYRHAMEQLRKA